MNATTRETAGDPEPRIAELQARAHEAERLLLDAEQRAASVPELELRIDGLRRELGEARASAREASDRLTRLDERLMDAERVIVDMKNSPSWQVTRPLRRAKQLLS